MTRDSGSWTGPKNAEYFQPLEPDDAENSGKNADEKIVGMESPEMENTAEKRKV